MAWLTDSRAKLNRPGARCAFRSGRPARTRTAAIIESLERLALLAVTVPGFTTTEGALFQGAVATFGAADITDPATATATIDWGDLTSPTSGIVQKLNDTEYSVLGSHTYAQTGKYTVVVTLADAGATASIQGQGEAVVNPSNLIVNGVTFNGVTGTEFTQIVATFFDPNPTETKDDFFAQIQFGDGQQGFGVVGDGPGPGLFTVTATHAFATANTYTITVSVAEKAAPEFVFAAESTAHINDPPPPGSLIVNGVTFDAVTGTPFTTVVATFLSPNAGDTSDDFFAQIQFGDGQEAFGVIGAGASPGLFIVTATHTYAAANTYTIVVSVADKSTPTKLFSANSTAHVNDPPPPGSLIVNGVTFDAVTGTPFTTVVATFLSPNAGDTSDDFFAQIQFGDGQEAFGVIGAGSGPGLFTVTATHTYAAANTYTIVVSVAAKAAPSIVFTANSTAKISDPPPAPTVGPIVAFGVQGAAVAGIAVNNFTFATFVDQSQIGDASDFEATIAFGDDTTGAGTVVATQTKGTFAVIGSHTYVTPGNYTATVTINGRGASTVKATANSTIAVSAPTSPQDPIIANQFVGALDKNFDTGKYDNDGVTNTPFPRFLGYARPFAVVFLYGRRRDHKEPTLLARAVAGADGSWSTQVGPLPDGRYVITATVSASGPGSANAPIAQHYVIFSDDKPLVIDTIGVSVVRVLRTAPPGRKARGRNAGDADHSKNVRVVLTQDLSGLDTGTLYAPGNYVLLIYPRWRYGPQNAKPPGDPQNLPADVVMYNHALASVIVKFRVRIPRHAALQLAGIKDVAGNNVSGIFPINGSARHSRKLPYH